MKSNSYFRAKRRNLKIELLKFFESKGKVKHKYPTSINYNEEAVIVAVYLYPNSEPEFVEEDDILYRFNECSIDFLCFMADRLSQQFND